jgi:hypothetical protein
VSASPRAVAAPSRPVAAAAPPGRGLAIGKVLRAVLAVWAALWVLCSALESVGAMGGGQ